MAKLPKTKFNLRLPNSKTETLISLIFRYKGKRLVYSTGQSIHPGDWDFKSQRPIQQDRRPDLFIIKRCLDDFSTYCLEIFLEANASLDKGVISVKEFKRLLDIKTGKIVLHETGSDFYSGHGNSISFFEFMDLELQEMKDQGMRYSSWKSFERFVNQYKKFAREVRLFDYDDVDWNFRKELIDWMVGKNRRLIYGNKTLSTLRQFLERAKRKKLHTNTAYMGKGWMVTQKKAIGQLTTFSPQELQRLADLKLSGADEKIRDLFLIGAGTGQRFSDYSRYEPDNFYSTINNILILSVISQKTDTPAKIPLNIFPWLIPVLEKHNYTSPKIPLCSFNKAIKRICKEAGFNENILVVNQYIGHKARVEKVYIPKYKQISSHTCRRSFATNLYRMGYRLAQIMPMTGHSTESQLREYIGIDSEQNAEEIAFSIMERRGVKKGSSGNNLRIVNS